ncbi:MAG: hypothetical protein Kow0042_16090 [Calditrichia bacterium]
MKKFISMFIVALLVLAGFPRAEARPFRVNQIPNGSINSCDNCHVTPGGPRTPFGEMIEFRFLSELSSSGNVEWNALLASLDADNDGVPNGEELQDRFGTWMIGNPQPGNSALVTLPGDPTENPLTKLTLQFTGMTPHVGQQLEIRVVDKSTGLEAGREEVSAIPGANFNVDMDVLLTGHSYWIDFYADLSGNSLYDPPPTDHAWRLELDNVAGDETVNFNHNTNFTDIEWVYELTVDFSGMTPHVGQLLEMRVTDQADQSEVGRTRVEFIPGADFSVQIPGIQLGRDYQVDFYADLSGNFLYDPPPTDHAWQMTFSNTSGDVNLNFAHNTNFTPIDWDYMFQMNLLSMNPHVGQLFELRVVDEMTGDEVGRLRMDNIIIADFVVQIPGIQPGKDYRADFYADFNGNGVYDPPPADHAWRVPFTDSTGNVVVNFTHNTNFTNINWPTGIRIDPLAGVPGDFTLHQNYPNPFNPETRIRFEIPTSDQVLLEVYNIVGQKVATLLNEHMSPGRYDVAWDAQDDRGHLLSSGIYIYKLTTSNFTQTRRMLFVK